MIRDNFLSVSGADYIRAMYANTVDGKLTIGDEAQDGKTVCMDWDEQAAEAVVTRFEKLHTALTRLGKAHTCWDGDVKDMPEDLPEVWNTYIRPYPDHGMDPEALFAISMKAEQEEPLTPEEAEMLEKQSAWLRENALTRLPYNRCNPAALIQRARRYEKLVALRAPKLIIDNEERCLAEEMALYWGQKAQ